MKRLLFERYQKSVFYVLNMIEKKAIPKVRNQNTIRRS